MTASLLSGKPPHLVRQAVRLDRYGAILAAVAHYGPERLADVVARFGLSAEDWRMVDETWSATLAEAGRRRQLEQALEFTSTFFRHRADLARRSPPIASIGGTPSSAVSEQRADNPMQRVELPTYQLVEQAKVARPETPSPAPVPAPPPAPAPAAPIAAAPPQAAKAKKPALGGTVVSDEPLPIGTELPFVKGAKVVPPPPAPPPPMAQSGDTDELDVRQIRGDDGGLTIESYARVTAQLAAGTDKTKVLASVGLDDAAWHRAATTWAARLRSDETLMRHYRALVRDHQPKR